MIFCKPSQRKILSNQQITVGNTALKEATAVKNLGVKFDRIFKVQEEVKNILDKMTDAIRTLSVIAQKLPLMTRSTLLECIVISYLNHSASLFT